MVQLSTPENAKVTLHVGLVLHVRSSPKENDTPEGTVTLLIGIEKVPLGNEIG